MILVHLIVSNNMEDEYSSSLNVSKRNDYVIIESVYLVVCVCVCACACVCVGVFVHLFVCLFVCLFACVCVCVLCMS